MRYGRVARLHRRTNRRWYTDPVRVERSTGTGWEERPQVKGSVQYRYAFASSAHPDRATVQDAETALLFCDPASDVRVADRITILRTGTVWAAVAVDDEQTDPGTLAVTLAAVEVAVAGETVAFYRAGLGAVPVATVRVQFTEGVTRRQAGATATGAVVTGVMLAGADAAPILPGDAFTRLGATGIVTEAEPDPTSGEHRLAYTLEVA